MSKCEACNKELHPKVSKYSWGTFHKPLCISCQKKERDLKYPPKLAKYLNNAVDYINRKERKIG